MHPSLLRPLNRSALFVVCLGVAPVLEAAQGGVNPTGKFYVAELEGQAEIDTGNRVGGLSSKSVYDAGGNAVETKSKSDVAVVFSNGTGAYFGEDTRMEVKRFEQESFAPNRIDMDVEPSVSETEAYLPRGTVGLCTSKMVAGSSMTFRTPHGSVNIRGGKIVIQSFNNQTRISMLEGDSTVSGRDPGMGGLLLRNGQQAIITAGGDGQPDLVRIQTIPASEEAGLQAKVAMAFTAKKSVYFKQIRPRPGSRIAVMGSPGAAVSGPDPAGGSPTGSDPTNANDASDPTPGPVSAFDGDNTPAGGAPPGPDAAPSNPSAEIIAVPVSTVALPVQDDASTSTKSTPAGPT